MNLEIASFGYLAALLVSIAGLAAIDHKRKIALFVHTKATVLSVSIGVVVFLIWDLLGIALGIFFRGDAPHLSGLLLAPELPVEELFFLILLCYNTLLAYGYFARRLSR